MTTIKDFDCTNNQAEYEALVINLDILHDLKAAYVLVLNGHLLFSRIIHSPTLGGWGRSGHTSRSASIPGLSESISSQTGWRNPNKGYVFAFITQTRGSCRHRHGQNVARWLEKIDHTVPDDPSGKHDRKKKVHGTNYVVYQNKLYQKGKDGLLLLCLGPEEVIQVNVEVHEGIRGAHQSGHKLHWLLQRNGYFWPSILKDCIEYACSRVQCLIHGPIQRVPIELLHSNTKPWPFRGWIMDVIGKVTPSSGSAKHVWILIAIDYFTKWV